MSNEMSNEETIPSVNSDVRQEVKSGADSAVRSADNLDVSSPVSSAQNSVIGVVKRTLSGKESIIVASMLFGLFFGAGNLIFPVNMGQKAGSNSWIASLGFSITGVGLPLLGIAALAVSEKNSLFDLSSLVNKKFAYFFTVVLYLTIGPLFAIPRTATVPFQVSVAPLVPAQNRAWVLAIFSVVFFALVLAFSLKPSRIVDWVGKFLNPLFLVVFAVLVITALVRPMGSMSAVQPTGDYVNQPFFTGVLEGYNTMDALASLAFGIILVDVIRSLGVREPRHTAMAAVKSGVFSSAFMFVIYFVLTIVGAQSARILGVSDNGGTALFAIAEHYYGTAGAVLLGVIISVACLKTAIGLITSISTTFTELFPRVCTYKRCAIFFTVVSLIIANAGLDAIIQVSVPVLLFLYPLTIVLMVLSVCGRMFNYRHSLFEWSMVFTMLTALISLIINLLTFVPHDIAVISTVRSALTALRNAFPLSSIGMEWVIPAISGAVCGYVATIFHPENRAKSVDSGKESVNDSGKDLDNNSGEENA